MEEQIKKTLIHTKITFICFWLLPIFAVIFGEAADAWIGAYVNDVRATYFSEAIAILLTTLCVPSSLKLFSWILIRKIDHVGISRALQLYTIWNIIRLGLLVLPLFAGFFSYYMALSNSGLLCALIALTASLFCFPTEERLRNELNINKKE